MSITLLVIITTVSAVIYMFYTYASLIKKNNKVKEAFYSVDIQLKKRYELIPNILKIVSNFMEFERTLLEEIATLRTQALNIEQKEINEKIKLDNIISQKMNKIFVIIENYPQIKSDKIILHSLRTYNEVEEHIAASRRFYNSACLELKNAVEIFPSSLMAFLLEIKAVDFFEAQEHEKQSINFKDYL